MKLHGAESHFTPGVGDAFECERIALRRREIQILMRSEDIGHGLGFGPSHLLQKGIANKSNTSVDANTQGLAEVGVQAKLDNSDCNCRRTRGD